MKNYLKMAFICLFAFSMAACSSTPKEKRAPCSWESRGACGSMEPMSHQDQL